MSFFDKLAQKAASMGKTADEFYAASRRYANAACPLAVLAGTVWYLFDLSVAIVPFALAGLAAYQSITSTMVASRIERLKR